MQRKSVDRHSSTASALSHRLAMTLGAQYHWSCMGFDVSTAFLQGLKFQEIETRARELGLECKKERQVWLLPPANIWRHLRVLGFTTVEDEERFLFRLLLHKAMYGLVDGPILFQMAFLQFLLTTLKFHKSLHDDNFLYKLNDDCTALVCVIVLHVDDLLVLAQQIWIQWVKQMVESIFGTPKSHALPFTWCGIVHEQLGEGHYFLHQIPSLEKLKSLQLMAKYNDTDELKDGDYSKFRSLLMSMLWLTKTRLDLLHSIVLLQTEMICPRAVHAKQLNNALKTAFENKKMNGLHF